MENLEIASRNHHHIPHFLVLPVNSTGPPPGCRPVDHFQSEPCVNLILIAVSELDILFSKFGIV